MIELTEYEKKTLLPVLIRGFQSKIGYNKRVSIDYIYKSLDDLKYKVVKKRLPLIIDYLVINSFVENLIYNDGYYVSENEKEIKDYLNKLNNEFDILGHKIEALNYQLYSKLFSK